MEGIDQLGHVNQSLKNRTQFIDVTLILVAIMWGSSYLASKDVATPDTVFPFLSLRFGIAAFVLGIILFPRLKYLHRQEIYLGSLYGVILSIIFICETFGVTQTSASNSGLIISLTIVFTPILEQTVQKKKLPLIFYIATTIAIIGVCLLTQSKGFTLPKLGDFLILLAAIIRSCHVTVISLTSTKSQSYSINSSRLTLIQLLVCFLLFSLISECAGAHVYSYARHLSLHMWLVIIYLGLACTVFAFLIQTWAVRKTSPAKVSLLLGTEPLWAAVCGITLGHDPVTILTIIGAVLILWGTHWGKKIENSLHSSISPSQLIEELSC